MQSYQFTLGLWKMVKRNSIGIPHQKSWLGVQYNICGDAISVDICNYEHSSIYKCKCISYNYKPR